MLLGEEATCDSSPNPQLLKFVQCINENQKHSILPGILVSSHSATALSGRSEIQAKFSCSMGVLVRVFIGVKTHYDQELL